MRKSESIKVVGLILLAIAGASIWFHYAHPANASGLFEGAEEFRRVLIAYLATVLGVVLGSGYRRLKQLHDTGATTIDNPRSFVRQTMFAVDLWLGLFGSPIVCLLILQSSAGMGLPALVTVAIENGFCCLIIVNGFVGQMGSSPNPPAAHPGVLQKGSN